MMESLIIACATTFSPLVALPSAATSPAPVAASPAPQDDTNGLPAGWSWELEPQPLEPSWPDRIVSRFVPSGLLQAMVTADGGIAVQHVRPAGDVARGSSAPQYRVYLSDADGNMISNGGLYSMGGRDLNLVTWRIGFDGDPADIQTIGLAVLDLAGRLERAAQAKVQAKAVGAQVLDLPIIGQPYAFELTDIEGKVIDSEQLRGKVVLIDFWATWCGPCMAKMPKLRALHAKHAEEGLVVIGINMDDELDTARDAVAEHELQWRHVNARQSAQGHDEFWNSITDITTIPRLLVIDRQGILREDAYPHDLEALIEPYLRRDAAPAP